MKKSRLIEIMNEKKEESRETIMEFINGLNEKLASSGQREFNEPDDYQYLLDLFEYIFEHLYDVVGSLMMWASAENVLMAFKIENDESHQQQGVDG